MDPRTARTIRRGAPVANTPTPYRAPVTKQQYMRRRSR